MRESDRAGRLVEDLLLMSRIDRGLERRRDEVPVAALVAHCVDSRRLTHPDVAFAVRMPSGLVVPADEQRLTQVLGNLLDNAVRADGPTAHVVVTGGSAHAGSAYLDVTDDGPGVPRPTVDESASGSPDSTRPASGTGEGWVCACRSLAGSPRPDGGDLQHVDRPGVTGACSRLTLSLTSADRAGAGTPRS